MKKAVVIIDGRTLAQHWRDDIAEQVRALGAPVGLAAVCVEEDESLRSFVKLKERAAREVGITFSSYFIDPRDITGAFDTIKFLRDDESVNGIFVELPMPRAWDPDALIASIPREKDVDALTERPLVPAPSAQALEYVLTALEFAPSGRAAVVIGDGQLVGRPVSAWLREAGAKVTVIDIDTPNPAAIAAGAELVVTGVGKPGLVTGEWIGDGAVVIDFGWADGVGDVDAESVKQKAGVLAPVPGGMGPLVITAALENCLTLATR